MKLNLMDTKHKTEADVNDDHIIHEISEVHFWRRAHDNKCELN